MKYQNLFWLNQFSFLKDTIQLISTFALNTSYNKLCWELPQSVFNCYFYLKHKQGLRKLSNYRNIKFLSFLRMRPFNSRVAGNSTTGHYGNTISYYQNTTQPNISQTDRLCLTRGGLLKALAYVWGKGSSIPPIFLLVVLVLGTQIEIESFLMKNSLFSYVSVFKRNPFNV